MRLLRGGKKIIINEIARVCIVGLVALLGASGLYANPVLDSVAHGNVTVNQTPNTTTVNQTSQQAIIRWQSFNIGQHQSTHFQQPAGGVALNRINPSQGPSAIYGRLTATGQIVLVNPAGIYFGPTAFVNVGGIVASTVDISDQSFLSGQYRFDGMSPFNGSVVNEGTIIAANHGLVALLGNGVRNDGMIEAQLGQVVLASGTAFTMNFNGNQMISFSVDKKALEGVKTGGYISANGGQVLITAKAAQGVLDNVINMTGIVEARSVSEQNGSIIISGDEDAGDVRVGGQVYANGLHANETGGSVQITGYNLKLMSGSTIDVSGMAGGGQILIGGDFQGQGSLPHANAVIMQPGVNLMANAISTGNGGKVVLWSDYVTKTAGYISAKGGAVSGNGGMVETSGKQYLEVGALTVDTRAANGTTGTWLLDPTDVTISAVADDNISFDGSSYQPTDGTLATSNLDVTNLIAQLDLTNITVTTTPVSGTGGAGLGDITVNSAITWNGSTTLTLDAENDIIINAPITASTGSVILNALNAIMINAAISVDGSFSATADTIGMNANVTSGLDQNYTTTTLMTLASSVVLTSNLGGVNIFSNTTGLDGGGFDLSLDVFSASTIDASISNLANLNKAGTGALSLTVANTYTGTTNINGGSVIVLDNNSLGADSASVVVNNNGNLALGNGTLALMQSMTFNNGSFLSDDNIFSANTLLGNITLGAGTFTVLVNDSLVLGNILTIAGAITNTGDVIFNKNGTGQLAFTNTNDLTPASSVNVNAGTVILANDDAVGSAQISVAGSAILQLSGSTLNIDNAITLANGATIIDDNTAGDNTLSGNISLNGTNTLAVNNSIGTLTLSGVLSGSSVTLVKSGAGALVVSGAGANTYSGNFNITAGTVEARKSTALGAGASAVTVSSGAALLLNGTALAIANNITFNGNGIGGTGVLIDNSTATNNTLSGNITLASNNSIIRVANSGNTLTISGIIDDGVSSFGFSKAGSGMLALSGANTFGNASNGLTITTGQVTAMNSSALGSSLAPGLVTNGAVLAVSGTGLSLANPLTINGTGVGATGALINTSGSNAWSGAITLASNSNIGVSNLADTFTISGAIGGNFNLTKVGSGVLALSNTNTYTGATNVNAGTLNLSSANALGTVGTHTSGVTVSNGATILLSGTTLAPTLTLNLIGTGVGGNGALRATGTSAWNGNITLTGNSTIASANALTLNGTINGAFNLTLSGAGNILLGSTIGNSIALASITSNINLSINSGTITTTGTQTYNNAVVLGADSVFSSTGNNTITFSAIDRDATARALTIGQTGNSGVIALNGNIGAGVNGALGAITLNTTNTTTIGGTIAAASLVTDAGGTTQINTTSIVTTGNQTYGDDVSLGASPTLNSGSGTLSFANLVAGLTRTLSLQSSLATGPVIFNGNVSLDGLTTFAGAYSVSLLGSLNSINTPVTFLNTNGVTLGNGGDVSNFNGGVTSTASTTTLGGAVNTSADALVFGALTIANNSSITTSGGALTIGTTNSNLANTNDFTISSGAGVITLNGNIGVTTALNNFSMTSAGAGNNFVIANNIVTATGINLTAGGTISGSGILTTGTLTTTSVGGTTLTGNHVVLNFNATNTTSGNISFVSTAAGLTTTGVSNTGGGNVSITDTNGLAVQASTNISAGAGNITLNAGTGTLVLNTNSLLLSTGVISLTQDLINFDATSQVGGTGAGTGTAATTIIQQSTAARTIGLAGGTGNLSISAASLNALRSTNVRIGNSASGAMDVGAWTPPAAFAPGVLTLMSAGTITQTGAVDLATSTSDIIFRAAGVTFTQANNIDNFAANVTGDFSLTSTASLFNSSLTDDLGTVNGVTTTNNNVTLSSGGNISDAVGAIINGAQLTTASVTGTVLDNANTVASFAATNSGVGAITLVNTAADLNITGITQSGTGNVTVTNNGAISISGSVAAGATNNITLSSTGTLSESGGGLISGATLIASSIGGLTFGGANAVTGFTATNTTSGNISLINTAAALTITAGNISQSGGGTVSIGNTGNLIVTGNITTTSAGSISLTGTGTDRILTVNGTVNSSGGAINYSFDNMTLSGSTNAGTGIVTLIPTTAAVLINLGGADAAGTLGLTDAKLDTVTASILRIGQGNSGNIAISAAITPASVPTLSLATGGSITETGTLAITNLKLSSVGAITLSQPNLITGTLAAVLTGSTNAFTFNNNVNGGSLTIGTVDGTSGITTLNGNATITLGPANALLFSQNVDLGTGILNLGVQATVTQPGGGITAGALLFINTSFNTTLNSATNNIAALGAIQSGLTFTLVNNRAAGMTQIGNLIANTFVYTNTAGTSTLTNASNAISILGNINAAGQTFNLRNTVALTQTASSGITASNFSIASSNTVTLDQNNLVGTLAANLSGSTNAFIFRNTAATALTIGTVNSIVGVTTNNGAITYIADNMALTSATNAGTAAVTLRATSNGTIINVGTGATDSGTVLGLSQTELATIAGTGLITIGDVSNTGNVVVAGTLDLARNLVLTSGNAVIVNAGVGLTTALTGLAVNASNGIFLNGNIRTNGSSMAFNNAVTLQTNETLTNLTGDITFNNTVNGAFALTLNTPGNNIFNGAIGGSTALTTLTTDATGTTQINGGVITTSGAQIYNDAVQLGASATLTSGTNITLNGAVSGGFNLNLTGSGSAGNVFTIASSTLSNNNIVVTGGAGANSLVLTTGYTTQTWNITANNAGNITGLTGLTGTLTFAAIGSLTGGVNNDAFVFTNASTLSGSVDGGAGGTNILNMSAYTTAISVRLTGANANGFSGVTTGTPNPIASGFSNISDISVGSNNDTLIGQDVGNVWTITGGNSGTLFNGAFTFNYATFENLSGGTANDSFILNGGTQAGTIDGGAGTDTFTADNVANTFTITGTNGGTATGVGGFSNIENLVGGTSTDNFTIVTGGSLAGSINGGSGANTLTGANGVNAWTITSANAGAVTNVAGGFTAIQSLVGGSSSDSFTLAGGTLSGTLDGGAGSDTLTADNVANTWTISSANGGSVPGITGAFSNIENLVGGTSTDNFIIGAAGSVAGLINGGAGTDSITGRDATNAWTIASANGGTVTNTGGFSNIENLIGGTGADDFTVVAGGSLTGSINGGNGTDMLTGANGANTWVITSADTGSLTNITGGFTAIENLVGGSLSDSFILAGGTLSGTLDGGAGTDTLTADNVANTWTISSANGGNVPGITGAFSNIENLVGGTSTDNFIIGAAGSVAGLINGGAGTDSITGRDAANAWTINSANGGTLTNTGGFSNIENLIGGTGADSFTIVTGGLLSGAINGGNGTDNLIGANGINTWLVTSADAGTVTNITGGFSAIENLIGGTSTDSFTLAGGTLSGSINGAGGTNSFIGDAVVSTWNITGVYAGAVTGVTGGFSNIQNLIGGNANNTFVFFDGGRISSLNGGSLANTNILDHAGISSPVTIFLSSTFVGTTRDGSNNVLNNFSNINQVNGDYANDVIDTSAKVFTVVETAVREGYIDDPLFYFGYLVQGSPPPPPPPPVPPTPPTPPDSTIDISRIIQQPIINGEQNTPTQTHNPGEWSYTGDTDENINDILDQFETEYKQTINDTVINPTCYSIGT